jgi:PAP2 superfamily
MEGWTGWVRASLYLTDFLQGLGWQTDKTSDSESIGLDYASRRFILLKRPPLTMFESQTRLMRDYMDQRGDRHPEILSQMGFPIDYFAMILGLNAARNRHTFELIAITQVIVSHVAMVAKHHLACRRPDRLGATVMPMIPTPGHGAFPSAHAAEAFAVATLLDGLLDDSKVKGHYREPVRLRKLLHKQAERIAVNRTVAGMHFPIDSWAGAALGEAVGQIVLAKCAAKGGKAAPRDYTAKDIDFSVTDFAPELWGGTSDAAHAARTGLTRDEKAIAVAGSDLFQWLWGKATDEFSLG